MKTLAALNDALTAAPLDAALHRDMAEAQRQHGDLFQAQVHAIAAGALQLYAAEPPARQALELCSIATAYFTNSDYKIAATLYRLVLAIAPDMAEPYMNLAAMCAAAGYQAEADACRQAAYRIQRVFIEQDWTSLGARRVLLLNAGRHSGNVPIEVMMPTAHWCRIKYIIDYAADEEDAQLPPYDLVFNAIGEPDEAALLAGRLERFAARCGRPVLNAPAMLPRTRRHLMPALLAGLDDVLTAPCLRHDGGASGLAGTLAAGALAFPLLVRAAASHGGDSLQRCENIAELQARLQDQQGAHYLTAYRDYRSTDGYYRKYRFIFIDRQPLPYHLAISSNWIVHYFSADMKAAPWKAAEEQRFLDDPAGALGRRAMDAVAAIARRVDLDYAGIDCTLLPDGRVLVFEANASMLVHHEPADSVFAYKNVHVQRIVDAFEQMLARRLPA